MDHSEAAAPAPPENTGTRNSSAWSRVLRRLAPAALTWALVAVEALAMGEAGWQKFESAAGWRHWFEVFGYPAWMSAAVGAAEIAGALLLLVPWLSAYAAAALILIMLGALESVLTHTTDLSAFDPAFHGTLLLIVLMARWRRRWRPGQVGRRSSGRISTESPT